MQSQGLLRYRGGACIASYGPPWRERAETEKVLTEVMQGVVNDADESTRGRIAKFFIGMLEQSPSIPILVDSLAYRY